MRDDGFDSGGGRFERKHRAECSTQRRVSDARAEKGRTQTERRDATRGLLVDTALRLFSERGAHGATLQDVAEAAGLSKGAVTHHFATKDALVDAALTRCCEDLLAVIEGPSREGIAPVEGLRRCLEDLADARREGLPALRVLAELDALALHDPRMATELAARRGTLARAIGRQIEAAVTATGGTTAIRPDALGHWVLVTATGALATALPDERDADGAPWAKVFGRALLALVDP